MAEQMSISLRAMGKAGFVGDTIGDIGAQLDFVTIITKPGTSQIITGFLPSVCSHET